IYGDISTNSDINATVDNQFVVRAQNMWFGTTSSPTSTSGRFLETSTGAYLSTGGTWSNSSSRALKTNFAPVNARAVLQQVLQLPIQTWNYKAEDAKVRHIGAISQDFRQVFGFGDSAESIATVDADGVAMAAIQGLHEELKDRDARIERLEQQAKQQRGLIDGLRKLLCAQTPRAEVCQRQ
ncbi:MAG: tail fiber domain-containing protein, partial [Acidobacteriota bacterium]